MAQNNQNMRAFNIGFGGSIYDESNLAAKIAKSFGVKFNSLDCSAESLAEEYIPTIYHVEMALANPSAIGKLRLSRSVRAQGVKVCITGEGSDEVFGGYAYFKLERIWRMLESNDPAKRAQAKGLLKRFEKLEHRSQSILWDGDMPWRTGPRPFGYPSYHQIRARYAQSYLARLYRRKSLEMTSADNPSAIFERAYDTEFMQGVDPFNAARAISFGQLAGYIIPTLGDRVEMANSVECRTPFLDRDLIDFTLKIPPEYFLDIERLREKDLLRRAFEGLVPAYVQREHKHPFLSPNWLSIYRTRAGRQLFEDLLSSQVLRQSKIFEPGFLKLIMTGWKYAAAGSKFFKRVDTFIGFALGVQTLERYFVANRPVGNENFVMQDRSPQFTGEWSRSGPSVHEPRPSDHPIL